MHHRSRGRRSAFGSRFCPDVHHALKGAPISFSCKKVKETRESIITMIPSIFEPDDFAEHPFMVGFILLSETLELRCRQQMYAWLSTLSARQFA